ncbi:MAG: hypothetical protein ACLFUB_07880 [Cyclobacteriaceae bacterium]
MLSWQCWKFSLVCNIACCSCLTLEEAAGQHGFSLKDLSGIIITYDDLDHVGSLYEIKSLYSSIRVWASQVEA